jgi:hypothetical protein
MKDLDPNIATHESTGYEKSYVGDLLLNWSETVELFFPNDSIKLIRMVQNKQIKPFKLEEDMPVFRLKDICSTLFKAND